ncbi:unnamed protein product [Linum tenue]|uniref:AB hydrolase-1 domain-containing protein n=1 Tax=Linum tenue TaxID=586396 RepID=A0AAV0L7D0_9ROSI|nr:unnamed protein product [Linum tenue]
MEEKKQSRLHHFVLVHGACHGAWCWYKVVPLLKQAGYKVTALDLAASGIHPKQATKLGSVSDYLAPLMELMTSLTGGGKEEKVILVGHSMGGVGISAAMEKFAEKVAVAVFVTAFMPAPHPGVGYSLPREEGFFASPSSSSFVKDGPENPPTSMLFGPKAMATKFYQLSPPEVKP